MSEMLPEKCSSCGGEITIVTGGENPAKAGWHCNSCTTFNFAKYDHPEVIEGGKLAESLEGVHTMDEAITSLPINVQIGILKERGRHNKDAYGKK